MTRLIDSKTSAARSEAEQRDRDDPLGYLRERFVLPPGIIYLDGNSLGALPHDAADRVAHAVRDAWGTGLIRSWNSVGWIDLPQRIGERIGRLIGARPGETLVCDSTSINLFKLLAAALSRARQASLERCVIVSERGNFPTDLYIAQGLVKLLGNVELRLIDDAEHDLAAALDHRTAVLMLTQVNFRSGRLLDMAAMTAQAHAAGALVLWDLAHSAGALPVDLHAANADYAVGCGYKYLSGGPGAPAFVWVHQRHLAEFAQPLSGWLGDARPFEFASDYQAAPGILRAQVGTPPVLAMVALECGVETLAGVDIAALRAKSIALSESFIAQVQAGCGDVLALASPSDPHRRGSQISLRPQGALAQHGYALMQTLIASGVIGDFRAEPNGPGLLRFGFAPAYLRYVDVIDAAHRLVDIVRTGNFSDAAATSRQTVT